MYEAYCCHGCVTGESHSQLYQSQQGVEQSVMALGRTEVLLPPHGTACFAEGEAGVF